MTASKAIVLFTAALCAVSWITYAEHPTARNLRAAIRDTLPLL
ncbi:MAG: hypothetical protein ACYC6M_12995 [Terriglobales bacterium]